MTTAKIAILMSTYNGQKYLSEQIESIQKQSYSNWRLYIRDDGSTDNTINIIKRYTTRDHRIIFFNQNHIENQGVAKSFMTLLENIEADYYMFADQDDYWKKDKIANTLDTMKSSEKVNINKPICVHTNLTLVDSNLKGNLLMNEKKAWSTFKELLFANCVTGCTVMINSKLKSLVDFNKLRFVNIYLHDWWIALIAAGFGKVVYLDQATMLYRQHPGNLVGSDKPGTKWHNKTTKHPFSDRIMQTVRMAWDFWKVYNEKIQGSDRRYVKEYASLVNHQSPFWNMKVVCICPPRRQTLKGDLFFSYLIVKRFRMFQSLNKDGEQL